MRVLKSILRAIWMVSLVMCFLLVCGSDAQAGFIKRMQQRRAERVVTITQYQPQPQPSNQAQTCSPSTTTGQPTTFPLQYIYSTPSTPSATSGCANDSCSPTPSTRRGWFR